MPGDWVRDLAAGVDVGAAAEEELEDLGLVFQRRDQQRRRPVLAPTQHPRAQLRRECKTDRVETRKKRAQKRPQSAA
eukprot:612278-Rhodomonas_salina.1